MTARPRHASWRAHSNQSVEGRGSPSRRSRSRWLTTAGIAAVGIIGLAACGSDDEPTSVPVPDVDAGAEAGSDGTDFSGTLRIGAIPDQDPEVLQRQFDLVSDHLVDELGVEVEYIPVTDYQSAVSGFAVGDLDLVWFGALTGIQARLEVDGADAILQRDIDAEFTSVFIARADSGLEPFDDVAGLAEVAGRSFTFGSESSTSGRLMPQFFLGEAGVDVESDLTGPPGFSGSHDATIELVTAGTYEVGAVASQVWDSRVADGEVDTDEVVELFRTPTYPNYHWVVQPGLDGTFGGGFDDALVDAFTGLDAAEADDAEILELFGAGSFIPTENENYDPIEATGRDVGVIR